MRTHTLSDIYREQNPSSKEYKYKDRAGTKTESRLDYFIVDQETASFTTKTSIEPITTPFDHSEITITVDFDKVMSWPGFLKINNSHIQSDRFNKIIKMELVHSPWISNKWYSTKGRSRSGRNEPKTTSGSTAKTKSTWAHGTDTFYPKAWIIKYSIATQRQGTYNKKQQNWK